LYVQGYQDSSLVDFELELSNPSTIFEQEKLEIWKNKINLSTDMMESTMFSRNWIYENVFKLSEDEIEYIKKDVVQDKKDVWRFKQIEEEGSDPAFASSEEGGGGGGGDMGGGGGELPDLGGGEDSGGGGGDSGGENAGGLPPLEEEKNADEPILDEETRKERELGIRPSQEGKKEEYSDTFTKTRGEDILGNGQNKEKSKSDRRTTHIYRGGALSMDEDLKRIKKSLMDKYNNKNKKIITEKKSIMDESNIIDDDKPL
jgi:hypothetical protein